MFSVFVMANAAASSPVWAQSAPPPAVVAASASRAQDDPAVLVPAEPDVVVVNLPTAMRMPLFKGNFRLTHRIRRESEERQLQRAGGKPLRTRSGRDYRLRVPNGRRPRRAGGFYRSSFAKTIQLYGKYDGLRQGPSIPVSVSGLISIEGANNFQSNSRPPWVLVISRLVGTRIAAYVTPMWAGNTDANQASSSTTYVGIGGRVRIAGSTYVAAEVAIRAGGYAPDEPAYGFSLEKRAGGHVFSLTFTNTFGTTFAQMARGGAANSLYLGFNLSRKFF
jgi:hypothetical protein